MAYLLIYNTGLRASELLALTWDNVDFEKGFIYVRTSLSHTKNRDAGGKKSKDVIGSLKTDKSKRDIPLNKSARDYLLFLREDRNGPYVVHNMNGDFLKLRSFQQTFKRACLYAGVPYKGLHALRHTFASCLIANDVAPKVVSDLLGHASVVFTLNRYVHSFDENVRSAVELLEM